MALEIKPIPVLRGKAAERFVEEADRNARERRGSIDFTKQVEKMRAILKRSMKTCCANAAASCARTGI